MKSISDFFSNLYSTFSNMLADTTLQWILLIGCALLAVALLILTLTRWGGARPVWKCVILSVVAHLLLVGYMYGTHLISRAPLLQRTDVISMNLAEPEPIPEVEQPEIVEREPAEDFEDHNFLPELEPLTRPAFDTEVEIEKQFVSEAGNAFGKVEFEAKQSPFSARPATIKPEGVPAITASSGGTVAPEQIEFQRREHVEEQDTIPMLDEGGDFEVPRIETELPRLEMTPPVQEEAKPFSVPAKFEPVEAGDFNPAPTTDVPRFQPASNTNRVISPDSAMIPVEMLRRPSDGAPMPKLYSLRIKNREAMAVTRGGTPASEKAVQSGLGWMATAQSDDGGWVAAEHEAGIETRALGHNRDNAGAKADTGITGLALLSFLASGNTHYEGDYRLNVQKGLEYLIRNQRSDGLLAGDAKLFSRMYCHSMALLALSEALAVTGDERIKPAVERGVEYSLRSQNMQDGGWRYQPNDPGDMSQFGWKVLSLHSASLGGVETPESNMELMREFLGKCTMGNFGGLGSYRPGSQPSETMTAEALVCRYFLSPSVDSNTMDEATSMLLENLPSQDDMNLYYWYYGTMAMYHTGGDAWRQWNHALQEVLLAKQDQAGETAGSWAPDGVWGGYGGRVYSTAMATLCLEVYYRHLPIYEARLR